MDGDLIQKSNNLYDCVINEIEKIGAYKKTLEKLTGEDFDISQMTNYDVDIMGFIQLKNQEILTDKMLRSFIDVSHAVERAYLTLKVELNDLQTTSVDYCPLLMDEIKNTMSMIVKLKVRKKLFDSSLNGYMINMHCIDYIKEEDESFNQLVELYKDRFVTVSTQEFRKIIDDFKDDVCSFMSIMKCELESKPYMEQTEIVMKHVLHVICIVSLFLMNITIDD